MSGQELCFLTLAEQARLIRAREISPVDVVTSVLRQIERIDGQVHAYITVMGDAALSAAREAEREIAAGRYRGPLHGVPIALKDLLYTKGVRTTAGSRILGEFVPEEDATVVARLREAGAVIVGKANMHEFAFGATNVNPHYGTVHNPWDPSRVSGGSSGGSAAAVALSMCSAALGSDTGGSIRIPAALCGVVGLKPTYGRVSRHGVVPLAWSLDTVGPMAETAEDAALVLAAIAGWDPKDPTSSREPVVAYAEGLSKGAAGLKIAVLQEYSSGPMESDVAVAFGAALDVLRQLGLKVETVSIPEVEHAVAAALAIQLSEVASCHEEYLRTRAADYGEDVRSRIELGLLVAATDYVKAQRVRHLLLDRVLAVLRRCDALVCPTAPITAPLLDQDMVDLEGLAEPRQTMLSRHTRLFSLASLPAVSVPCGFASNGLPVGLQIAAAPFAEETALRIAHAYQQATRWQAKVPPTVSRASY